MARNVQLRTKLNEPSQDALRLPFYNALPKDRLGLLKWRLYVRKRCLEDKVFRAAIMQACAADVAFFAATFITCHETREGQFANVVGKFPFMPWCDQVDILAWFMKYVGKADMTVEKTRGIGLSWCIVIFVVWLWLFKSGGIEIGLLSKDDSSLDVVGRPSTLMGKIDCILESLPAWMTTGDDGEAVFKRTHQNHKFEHFKNKNAIIGYTATNDKLRSARLYCLFADESAFLPVDTQRFLASSQHVSPSRVFVSTHDGSATFFYRMTIDEESNLVRISTWWQDNPARSKGMYRSITGQIEFIDLDYKWPVEGYNFHHENPGLERSPWVDSEFEKTGADPVSLMQEIYGVAAIHSRKLFSKRVLSVVEGTVIRPRLIGDISDDGEFTENLDGCFRLFKPISALTGAYVVGVDPSLGSTTGAYAGISAFDVKTGEVVLTGAVRGVAAPEFAKMVVGVCKLLCGPRGFGNAIVAYESTGIGITFAIQLKNLRYPAVYCDKPGRPGIHTNDNGEKILVEMGRAIQSGEYIIRDQRIASDITQFEYDRKEELVFAGQDGHGDLGMSAALGWWAGRVRRRAIFEADKPKNLPPEMEPVLVKMRQNSQVWSRRYG